MNPQCSLSELTVENFKAFAEKRQYMPIRPVTLVYGPNSSGKSSLLQAIALAHEALTLPTGTIDTHRTHLAGKSIDLGGFQQYVHRCETNRNVNLGFRLEMKHSGKIFIEFVIGASNPPNSPHNIVHTKRFSVRSNGKMILSFQFDPSGIGMLERENCDWDHPLVSEGRSSALNARILKGKLFPSFHISNSSENKFHLSDSSRRLIEDIRATILRDLRSMSYLGPLRYFPDRDFYDASDNQDPNWRSGGAWAWDAICRNQWLRDRINRWLSATDRLRTPYKLAVHSFGELDDSGNRMHIRSVPIHRLRLVDMRTNTTVSHKDVGIGVSQVLPVLAMALGSQGRLITIEQPELHLHPAIQAELADVFIDSAIELNNRVIIETHSEDFVLRILRRIRESSEFEGENLPRTEVRPDQISVIYVQPSDNGSRIVEIPLTRDGQFGASWPDGFFAERIKELI